MIGYSEVVGIDNQSAVGGGGAGRRADAAVIHSGLDGN